ncbi:uncharacterized protein LOC134280510, partial [Saccostrea cucullata]|uniref:uncharacterized protein LOC134280510 n=1 Tax=Saccostrea cuccullata TaxID=36930 RepID=UPI002ED4479B
RYEIVHLSFWQFKNGEEIGSAEIQETETSIVDCKPETHSPRNGTESCSQFKNSSSDLSKSVSSESLNSSRSSVFHDGFSKSDKMEYMESDKTKTEEEKMSLLGSQKTKPEYGLAMTSTSEQKTTWINHCPIIFFSVVFFLIAIVIILLVYYLV